MKNRKIDKKNDIPEKYELQVKAEIRLGGLMRVALTKFFYELSTGT